MTKPSIGRVVLVRDADISADPFPAMVTRVWSETEVTVTGFPANGDPVRMESLPLAGKESDHDLGARGAWWPPRA